MAFYSRRWTRRPPASAKVNAVAAFLGADRFDLASGRQSSTGAFTAIETPLGGGYRGVLSAGSRSVRAYPFTAASPLALVAAFQSSAATDSGVRITNTEAGFRLLEIVTDAGFLKARARGSDSVVRTVTGPAANSAAVFVAVATWEPGIGVSLSVDGEDYGTASFTQNLSHAPSVLQDAFSASTTHVLSAWLDEADIPRRTEISRNPWRLFAPRRIWVPQAPLPSLPTLSLPTYTPGSLTATGFRPRVTAT